MRLKINQSGNPESVFVASGNSVPAIARPHRRRAAAFTLVEVVISAAIVALVFGSVITAYIQSGERLEWTGYSLAAQQMGNSVLEQAHSGVWDPTIPENDLTNMSLLSTTYTNGTFTGYCTGILDIPYSSTNYILATNFVTIQLLNVATNSSSAEVQYIRVDTVWPFSRWKQNNYSLTGIGGFTYYTNTVVTMIAPDNRDPNSF